MLLGFSFESRSKSRALATAGSVMKIGYQKKGTRSRQKKKTVLQEKIRLTSPEVWAAATSRFDEI